MLNNILWVPLDLPPIPKELTLKKLKEHYSFVPDVSDEKKKELEIKKQHHLYAWSSFRIRSPQNALTHPYKIQMEDSEWQWEETAKILCPKLIEYIQENLPFNKIKLTTAISSAGKIPLHYDLTESISDSEKMYYKNNDPCFYRLLLDGNINQNSFYVFTKKLGKVYCQLPENSPGWVMGSYSCGHGNDETEPEQKLLLYIMGDLNLDRHQSLIEKSYNKFKDYTIIKDYDT